LKKLLVRIDYIKPDNPDYWINKIRHFGTRMGLRAREVSIIRGICRQCDWYAKKCYQDGQKSRLKQQNTERCGQGEFNPGPDSDPVPSSNPGKTG
jgi:tRNA/rRNA methyltransferase